MSSELLFRSRGDSPVYRVSKTLPRILKTLVFQIGCVFHLGGAWENCEAQPKDEAYLRM